METRSAIEMTEPLSFFEVGRLKFDIMFYILYDNENGLC